MELKIQDVMLSGKKNAIVESGTLFREVLIELDKKRLGAVCVVENEKLVGIVTDGDIRRMLLKTQHALAELFVMNVEKVMIKNPKAIFFGKPIEDAVDMLVKNRFWVLPVVNGNGDLVGMLHLHDILKVLPLKWAS
jgi:arabinose-5-phosphate isomerase